MDLGKIQRCVSVAVTVYLLLNRVSVAGEQTVFTATSEEKTVTRYMYSLITNNEDNTIVIRADNQTALVQFSVKTSQALNQTQCARGGNKVYSEGLRESNHYLGTFCGGKSVQMFVASHNSMTIVLDNNMALTYYTTMTLTYKIQKDCGSGATAVRTPRYIRTPGYPNGGIPTQFSTCSWVIVAPSFDDRVQISLKFATPTGSPNCGRSNVTVMDGESLIWYRRIIGTWCGESQRGFISWQYMMGILARGLEHLSTGFEIEFVSVPGEKCEHKIDADNITSGVITSPGYPQSFADLLECRWEIRVSERKNIKITVLDSDMDSSSGCTRDNVKIYTKSQALRGALRTWCGTEKPSFDYYSFVVLVVFKAGSHNNNRHKGFKLQYDIDKDPLCGGNLTAYESGGQISTTSYPNPFPGYQKCIWYIQASNPLKNVDLSVVHSDLYQDFSCSRERVAVYDGWTATEDKRLGRWCGTRRPNYRSQSPYMMVVFTSDRSNTKRKGFKANYGEGMCGQMKKIESVPLWIASPGYPANYESGYNCFWNLTASWGAIAIRFTDLDIRCPRDTLTIYDGAGTLEGLRSDHRSWTVCGTGTYSYLSTRLDMFIHLQTQTNQGKGFNLTYSGYYDDVAGCGRYYKTLYFNTNRLVWHSPGYPGNYFDNLSCRWLLAGSTKVRLEIKVKGIRGQSGNNCGGDYISVHDGYDETAPVLYNKLCRDITIESSWRQMFVKFVTDGANTGPGFTLYYQGFGDEFVPTEPPGKSYSSYNKYKRTSKGTFNPWILVGGLLPTLLVVGIIIGVLVHVKCKYSSSPSCYTTSRRARNFITDYDPSTLRRNNPNRDSSNSFDTVATTTNNRNTPRAPSDFDNQRADPFMPPPSYYEIDQFPAERNTDDDTTPPPPSYTDALQGGMIQDSQQNHPEAESRSITYV